MAESLFTKGLSTKAWFNSVHTNWFCCVSHWHKPSTPANIGDFRAGAGSMLAGFFAWRRIISR